MGRAVVVRGLTETQNALNAAVLKFNAIKTVALERFAKKVANIAKVNYPSSNVDTGALLESIGNRLLKATATEIIEEIFVGSKLVIRGEGRFIRSIKTGKLVSSKATEEYAEFAHQPGNPNALIMEPVMEQAFQWANANIDSMLRKLINDATKGL